MQPQIKKHLFVLLLVIFPVLCSYAGNNEKTAFENWEVEAFHPDFSQNNQVNFPLLPLIDLNVPVNEPANGNPDKKHKACSNKISTLSYSCFLISLTFKVFARTEYHFPPLFILFRDLRL